MDISERIMECYNLGLNVKYLYHQMVALRKKKKKKNCEKKMFYFSPERMCVEFAEWFSNMLSSLLDHPLCPVFKPESPLFCWASELCAYTILKLI